MSTSLKPNLFNDSAVAKYESMKFNFMAGAYITFHSNPDLLLSLKRLGWDCLVTFDSRNVYPELVSEFYAHMEFLKNAEGTLTGISTFVQGQKVVLDQTVLLEIFQLDPNMLSHPKVNYYVSPIEDTVVNGLNFKFNLSVTSDQFVPACLFDEPLCIPPDFLTPKCQFLSQILKNNFMPVRFDKKVHPFDLEIMKHILHESLAINLPHFLLTCFEHCFVSNCLGFGLLLTKLFQFLELDLDTPIKQTMRTSNLVSRIVNPPKPLFLFELTETEKSYPTNIDSQLGSLSNMVHMLVLNQSVSNQQWQLLTTTVQSLQVSVTNLMEQQGMHYNFGPSVNSVQLDPFNFGPSVPPLDTPFSPINLDEM